MEHLSIDDATDSRRRRDDETRIRWMGMDIVRRDAVNANRGVDRADGSADSGDDWADEGAQHNMQSIY